jgi:hypothetical protein
VLLAAVGAAFLLASGTAHAGKHAAAGKSSRVETKLAVSIVTPRLALRPRAVTAPAALAATSASVGFTQVAPGSDGLSTPIWTADQMVGGSFIFIDVSNGRCLAGPARPVDTIASLQQCDLGGVQRWQRLLGSAAAAGHPYFQLRNAADGLCLTLGGAVSSAASGRFAADLAPCRAPQPSRQLVTFVSG